MVNYNKLSSGDLIMVQASEEFNEVIDHIYGVYLDSTTLAFRLLREWVINDQLSTSKITGLSIEDLDKSKFYFGVGDPNTSDSHVLLSCTQGQLKKRNDKDSDNYIVIANISVVLIYQYWEDSYREQIAKQLGLPNKNDLKLDIMGDLRLLRNSIIHHNAVALKEVENCKLLKWFKEKDKIYINSKMFETIIFHIKEFIKLIKTNSN